MEYPKRIIRVGEPDVAIMIFIMDHGRGAGHTGIVEKVTGSIVMDDFIRGPGQEAVWIPALRRNDEPVANS
jgi:hypothetical protein